MQSDTVAHLLIWQMVCALAGFVWAIIVRRYILRPRLFPFFTYGKFGLLQFGTLTVFLLLRSLALRDAVSFADDMRVYVWIFSFTLGGMGGYAMEQGGVQRRSSIRAGLNVTEDGGLQLVEPTFVEIKDD